VAERKGSEILHTFGKSGEGADLIVPVLGQAAKSGIDSGLDCKSIMHGWRALRRLYAADAKNGNTYGRSDGPDST